MWGSVSFAFPMNLFSTFLLLYPLSAFIEAQCPGYTPRALLKWYEPVCMFYLTLMTKYFDTLQNL